MKCDGTDSAFSHTQTSHGWEYSTGITCTTKMEKNEVSVLGVSEVRWKGQGEIRSGDYTVYYSGGERAERGVVIVVHKRSVVKKIVCNDRIIAIKFKAEPVSILIMQVYMATSQYEDDEV